jgi:hypothetical protein
MMTILRSSQVLYDPAELAWLERLITAAFPSATFTNQGWNARNYKNGAVLKLELTDRYFRAIANIGFHYFLRQFPPYVGV